MRMNTFLPVLAVAAIFAGPAFAQSGVEAGTGTNPTVRQPNGAVVPIPPARTGTSVQGPVDTDPTVTGSVRSRDTTGLPQSPEARNAFGCRQIDPLCQGGR
ncbi:hypothetical protein ABLE91_03120 [Aquabacter sp. CN5-332]|uniref:hypothetical protein n=1 Tax=Aquabacter sp. CN5-332 TaxID=3156608 RepID=UPI0032B4CF24